MKNALQQKIFVAGVRGSSYTVHLSYNDAVENRDAFAKVCDLSLIYLFLYIHFIGNLRNLI
jgi:hypothetical protein